MDFGIYSVDQTLVTRVIPKRCSDPRKEAYESKYNLLLDSNHSALITKLPSSISCSVIGMVTNCNNRITQYELQQNEWFVGTRTTEFLNEIVIATKSVHHLVGH